MEKKDRIRYSEAFKLKVMEELMDVPRRRTDS